MHKHLCNDDDDSVSNDDGSDNNNGSFNNDKAQIDLLIDRKDGVINICEIKFSNNEFLITKKYAQEIRKKIGVFVNNTNTKKAIYFTLITTYGVVKNEYALDQVQNELTINDLF